MGNSQYVPNSKCFSEKEIEKIINTYKENFGAEEKKRHFKFTSIF